MITSTGIKLFDYQETAVNETVAKLTELLKKASQDNSNDYEKYFVQLKAPTGAGKTVIAGSIMEQLAAKQEVAYIWVSPGSGGLNSQSAKSLKSSTSLTIFEGDETSINSRKHMKPSEVMVINWEKMNRKEGGRITRESERTNLTEFCANTTCPIILVVDESHKGLKSEAAHELRTQILKPDVSLFMSATPQKYLDTSIENQNNRGYTEINIQKVITSGMLKKAVKLNTDVSLTPNKDAYQTLISSAITKRKELQKEYSKENSVIKPLGLIQIQNANNMQYDRVLNILKTHGITEENGRLAIWMSNKKTPNLNNIEKPESGVEWLIFKQAIATGWDCPRAQVLVQFRETKSLTLQVQTLGRILRMPERKHYDNEKLNVSYMYTDAVNPKVDTKWIDGQFFLHIEKAMLKENIKMQGFPCKYRSRAGNFQDVVVGTTKQDFYFPKHLRNAFNNNKKMIDDMVASGKLSKNPTRKMLVDIEVDTENALEGNIQVKADGKTLASKDDMLGKVKEIMANSDWYPSYPAVQRSAQTVLNCLPKAASTSNIDSLKNLAEELAEDPDEIPLEMRNIILRAIVMFPKQMQKIVEEAVNSYHIPRQNFLAKETTETIEDRQWNMPEMMEYASSHETRKMLRYAYDKYFVSHDSTNEERFEEKLDATDNIKWFYRNPKDLGASFVYRDSSDNDKTKNFYPDYIVKTVDDKIGFLEVKDEGDVKGEQTKSKALDTHQYIESETIKKWASDNNVQVFFGICIQQGKENGIWKYHNGKNYTCPPKEGWLGWSTLFENNKVELY